MEPTTTTIVRDNRVRTTLVITLSFLALFLLGAAIVQFKTIGTIGEGITATNTITVSGTGTQLATPDVADITFGVTAQASTVAAAQATVTTTSNAVLAYLTAQNVATADVQTTDYQITPQYDYSSKSSAAICPADVACPPVITSGPGTLVGYSVTASFDVKVRDLTNAGTILSGLGTLGVTDLSGLNFTIDNPEQAQSEAQAKAITDAQTNAQALASQLGVRLVRIVSFNNSGGNYPEPMFVSEAMSAGGTSAAVAPVIPAGQDTITSNVSITYEIQ